MALGALSGVVFGSGLEPVRVLFYCGMGRAGRDLEFDFCGEGFVEVFLAKHGSIYPFSSV